MIRLSGLEPYKDIPIVENGPAALERSSMRNCS